MLAIVSFLKPKKVPSFLTASSAWVTWSLPWQSDKNDSVLSATHFTGLSIFFAAQLQTTSSA